MVNAECKPAGIPIRPFPLARSGTISGSIAKEFIMEAERINSLSALLADLKTRETELRGYL